MKMGKQQTAAVELVRPFSFDGPRDEWEGMVHCETTDGVSAAVATNSAVMAIARVVDDTFDDRDVDPGDFPFPKWAKTEKQTIGESTHEQEDAVVLSDEIARIRDLMAEDGHEVGLKVHMPDGDDYMVCINARYMVAALQSFDCNPVMLTGGRLAPVILQTKPVDGVVALRIIIMPLDLGEPQDNE
jgi:hypothetical protein